MPLPPDFPQSPHEILAPDSRWAPDNSDRFWDKLPPLVEKLCKAAKAWRDGGYREVSRTTAALLDWCSAGAFAGGLAPRLVPLLLRPAGNEIFSGMILCGLRG